MGEEAEAWRGGKGVRGGGGGGGGLRSHNSDKPGEVHGGGGLGFGVWVLDVFHILVRKDVTKEFVVVDLDSRFKS